MSEDGDDLSITPSIALSTPPITPVDSRVDRFYRWAIDCHPPQQAYRGFTLRWERAVSPLPVPLHRTPVPAPAGIFGTPPPPPRRALPPMHVVDPFHLENPTPAVAHVPRAARRGDAVSAHHPHFTGREVVPGRADTWRPTHPPAASGRLWLHMYRHEAHADAQESGRWRT